MVLARARCPFWNRILLVSSDGRGSPGLTAGGQRPPGRLAGRRILVVGGGRSTEEGPPGNGHAISVLAAREGAALAVADIDARAAATTVAAIESEQASAAAVVADVRRPSDCERLVAEASAALGSLDGLVLNVGIGMGRGLAGTDSQTWDDVFAVNLRSHFLIVRAALPLMEDGAVVFIGSLAGIRPGTFSPSYDASKAGFDRAVPPHRLGGQPARGAGQRGRARAHRHPDGPPCIRRPPGPRPGAYPPRPPGHAMGGGLGGGFPAI